MERGVAARPCPYPSPFASRSLRSREAKPSPARGEGERLATLPSPEQRGGDVVLLEDAIRVCAQAMARAAAERAGAAEPEAEVLGPGAPAGKLVIDGLRPGHVERRAIVDGIRHPATLAALKAVADRPVAVLFIYTPPDVAYDFYQTREAAGRKLDTSNNRVMGAIR